MSKSAIVCTRVCDRTRIRNEPARTRSALCAATLASQRRPEISRKIEVGAAAIILVVNTLGTNLNTTFSSISTAIK
jgi:hypothetical protein